MGHVSTTPAWQPPSCMEMQALLPQYEFQLLIGRGGMGAVYKAIQKSLDRPVAIKCLPSSVLNVCEDSAQRFRQEALTMAKLNHPGIVGAFESGTAGTCLFIVMEFIDGVDLGKKLKANGRFSEDEAVAVMIQACDALEYAHQKGVIHRDLKPTNLLMDANGRIKIADFGLAKWITGSHPELTQSHLAIGTPEFLAPEAWEPGNHLDTRADLYSLGVTLYQLLTGEVPRGLWKMPSVKVGTDPRFDAVIDRAMQPTAQDRYPSAAEMRRELDLIRTTPRGGRMVDSDRLHGAGTPVGGAAIPWSDRLGPLRRFPWRLLSGIVIAFLVVFLGVHTLFPKSPQPKVRNAAEWLLNEQAEFKILSEQGEIEIHSEQELPSTDFQISSLWFDRWIHGPPEPAPPANEFEVLRAVTTLQVAFLRLPGLPPSALSFLAQNSDLRRLDIDCPEAMTDEVFQHIHGLRHLEKLAIGHSPRVSGRNLAGAAWLKNIEDLDLTGTGIGDEALQALVVCQKLRQLRLEGTPITGLGLQSLKPLGRLRHLALNSCPRLEDEDLAQCLPQLAQLKKLELQSSHFGPEAAVSISALTNLTELRLSGSRVTDEDLARLSQLPRLEILSVRGTRVTRGALNAFSEAHPQVKLER